MKYKNNYKIKLTVFEIKRNGRMFIDPNPTNIHLNSNIEELNTRGRGHSNLDLSST